MQFLHNLFFYKMEHLLLSIIAFYFYGNIVPKRLKQKKVVDREWLTAEKKKKRIK